LKTRHDGLPSGTGIADIGSEVGYGPLNPFSGLPPPFHPFWQFMGAFLQRACSKSCYGGRKYDKSLQTEVVDTLTAPLTADNSLMMQSHVASPFSLKYQYESPGPFIVCHLAFVTY
jgi:hypothetical protein